MNASLKITKNNLRQGKGFLMFLKKNLEQLIEDTKDYPVLFRCGEFKTIFNTEQDIRNLIILLETRIKVAEAA